MRTRRVRAFRASERWLNSVLGGLRAVHEGVWLGILDGDALDDATARFYASDEQYRTRSHNNSGLFSWERFALSSYFHDCNSILVGAVGAGRELIALVDEGRVVGAFDSTAELVASSHASLQEHAIDAEIVLAAPNEVPNCLGIYDALIMGWSGYSHIAGRQRRVRFLKQFRGHVSPGGPLLLSFVTRTAGLRRDRVRLRIAQAVRALQPQAERVEPGDVISGGFWHYFTEDELDGELREAGFELVHFSQSPFGHAVARAVAVGAQER